MALNQVQDILLAQLISRRALVPRLELAGAVREYLRAHEAGEPQLLGQLLVRRNLLDAAQFVDLRGDDAVQMLECPGCRAALPTADLEGDQPPCPLCGAGLELMPMTSMLRRLEQTTRRRRQRRRGEGRRRKGGEDGRPARAPTTGKRRKVGAPRESPGPESDAPEAEVAPAPAVAPAIDPLETPDAPIEAVPPVAREALQADIEAELDDSGARLVGRMVGGYEILDELAQGGMGIVFRARQPGLNRIVALKILKDKLSSKSESVQRFIREARAASRMNHANIVSIIEVGAAGNLPFLTMDYIDGTPLDEMIADGPIEPRRAVEMMAKLADAMRYAHGCDVVHRDLKPSNIIVDADGGPHITDFGLAKRLDSKSRVTETGALVGTPYYMAPEQISGDGTVAKSWDTYALGVIMYEMLTGELPFDGETTMEVYHRILNRDPKPPRQLVPRVPPPVERVCLKAMERDEALRYRTTAELARDLESYLAGRPVRARPLGWMGRFLRRYDRHAVLYTIIACALVIALGSLLILGMRLYRARQAPQAVEVPKSPGR